MSWLSIFTGYDEENAARAEAAQAQLKAMGGANNDYFTDFNQVTVADQTKAQEDSFNADVRANADTIIGAPLRFVGRVLGAVLLGIPLWVWLVAGGFAFFYLGGGPVLKKWFKKQFA
jgi:hypothetical protein